MAARIGSRFLFLPALLLTLLAAALAAPHARAQDKAPGLVGIRIGQNVSEVKDLLLMDTAVPVWSQEYLVRADLAPLHGYKGGYVSYGNCARPGRILRMKLNYEDGGRRMFDKLLAALKERYGKKPEFRGDPFGALKVWKWSLRLPSGENVSLILENYEGDDDLYSRGNTIRLSVPAWINEEATCQAAREPASQPAPGIVERPQAGGFDWFLPMK